MQLALTLVTLHIYLCIWNHINLIKHFCAIPARSNFFHSMPQTYKMLCQSTSSTSALNKTLTKEYWPLSNFKLTWYPCFIPLSCFYLLYSVIRVVFFGQKIVSSLFQPDCYTVTVLLLRSDVPNKWIGYKPTYRTCTTQDQRSITGCLMPDPLLTKKNL